MHLVLYRMPLQLFLQKAPHKSAFLSNPPFLFCHLPTRLFRKEHPFGICHTSRCKNLCTSAKLHAYFFAPFALNVFLQKKGCGGQSMCFARRSRKGIFQYGRPHITVSIVWHAIPDAGRYKQVMQK